MAAILRVPLIFLLILLVYANSAKALQCYKCVSADNESCKKEPGAKYLTVCDEPTATGPSSSTVSASASESSTSASPPSSSGSGSSTASSSESSSSASPPSSSVASSSTTSTSESSSSASSLSSTGSTSSTTSTSESSSSASTSESRQIRNLLLNRFEGPRQSEQAYCFMHAYQEGETQVVERGCTTNRNYCQEQEKKLSCEICNTDECNLAANTGFTPVLLVFAAATIILR